eukprot:scaffold45453_cov32-Tisochrysis_lutea.AAC.4
MCASILWSCGPDDVPPSACSAASPIVITLVAFASKATRPEAACSSSYPISAGDSAYADLSRAVKTVTKRRPEMTEGAIHTSPSGSPAAAAAGPPKAAARMARSSFLAGVDGCNKVPSAVAERMMSLASEQCTPSDGATGPLVRVSTTDCSRLWGSCVAP